MRVVDSNDAVDQITQKKGLAMKKSVSTNKGTVESAAVAFATATVQRLDALADRRKQWEVTEFAKANEGLYAILAECQEIYEEKFLNAGESDQKALRADLKQRLEAVGAKVQSNTMTLTMVVRFVFGSDRKRAHGYNYVIRAAISHEVKPLELASWIKANGGIEEIKRKNVISDEALANRDKREAALDEVKSSAETAAIDPLGLVEFNESIELGEYAVLVVQPSTVGTANVLAVLAAADNAVIQALYKKIARVTLKAKEEEEQRKQEAAVNKPVAKDTAVQEQRLAA
jgi:hypothetical protein